MFKTQSSIYDRAFSAKIVNDFHYFSQKASSELFDSVLDMPLTRLKLEAKFG